MDFKKLAEEAAAVTVDGKKVMLRAPSLETRKTIWTMLRQADSKPNDEAAETWLELTAIALQDTVVSDTEMDEQAWSRVISMADTGHAPDGLKDLIAMALTLCGLKTEVSDDATDNIQEAVDNLGESDS